MFASLSCMFSLSAHSLLVMLIWPFYFLLHVQFQRNCGYVSVKPFRKLLISMKPIYALNWKVALVLQQPAILTEPSFDINITMWKAQQGHHELPQQRVSWTAAFVPQNKNVLPGVINSLAWVKQASALKQVQVRPLEPTFLEVQSLREVLVPCF